MIGPWQFALVSLAAWRTWHLIALDAILDRPREMLHDRWLWSSVSLHEFTECPWCAGFWIALAWVVAFWIEPHWTVVAAVPFAVSAAVAMLQLIADALTD